MSGKDKDHNVFVCWLNDDIYVSEKPSLTPVDGVTDVLVSRRSAGGGYIGVSNLYWWWQSQSRLGRRTREEQAKRLTKYQGP